MRHPWQIWGVLGGRKTPPNLTQNGRFWLKHDRLTLLLHKQVNSSPLDLKESRRQDLEPTGAILVKNRGSWGGGRKHPQI